MGNNSLKCDYYTKENEIEIKEKKRKKIETNDKLNTDNINDKNMENNLNKNLKNNEIDLNSYKNNNIKENLDPNLNQNFKNNINNSNNNNIKNQKVNNQRLEKIDISPIRHLDNKDERFIKQEYNQNNNELTKLKQNNKNQIYQNIHKNDNYINNIDEKIEDLLKRTHSDSYISLNINKIENEEIKFNWKDLDILSFVNESKLKSNDPNIIIHFGYLNKFLLSGNISSTIEKFCLLSKKVFCIYKSKESLLMKEKPVLMLNLSDVEKCDRINIDYMNRKNLENCYFFYILKKNVKNKIQNNNLNRLIDKIDYKNNIEVYNILFSKKIILEQILFKNELIILYSELEEICDKWVCCINYFLNNSKK